MKFNIFERKIHRNRAKSTLFLPNFWSIYLILDHLCQKILWWRADRKFDIFGEPMRKDSKCVLRKPRILAYAQTFLQTLFGERKTTHTNFIRSQQNSVKLKVLHTTENLAICNSNFHSQHFWNIIFQTDDPKCSVFFLQVAFKSQGVQKFRPAFVGSPHCSSPGLHLRLEKKKHNADICQFCSRGRMKILFLRN